MTNLKEAITHLSNLVERVLEETISQSDIKDLTHLQLHYLRIIERMQNPTITELAKALKLTKPTVTVMIDKLEEKGYVTRVKSDDDRRCMHLHVGKNGDKISSMREIAHERMLERIEMSLNETEAMILSELLKKIGDYGNYIS